MSRRPRLWEAGIVYVETVTTVDRAFLLKPDVEIKNIVGACAGRALKKYPVNLHWMDQNNNHLHFGRSPIPGLEENMSKFLQLFLSMLAKETNAKWKREGPVWATRARSQPCVDNESAERHLLYSMTNAIKDGLADKVSHWAKNSFSSYDQLCLGKSERYSYLKRSAWHKAGGSKCQKPISEFVRFVEVTFAPLPHLAHLAPHTRQAHFRREVRIVEKACREERQRQNRTVPTKERLAKLSPFDKPKTPRKRSRQPLCHACSKGAADDFKERWRQFLDAFYTASGKFLSGMYNTEFPPGSFRPPLTTMYKVVHQ